MYSLVFMAFGARKMAVSRPCLRVEAALGADCPYRITALNPQSIRLRFKACRILRSGIRLRYQLLSVGVWSVVAVLSSDAFRLAEARLGLPGGFRLARRDAACAVKR